MAIDRELLPEQISIASSIFEYGTKIDLSTAPRFLAAQVEGILVNNGKTGEIDGVVAIRAYRGVRAYENVVYIWRFTDRPNVKKSDDTAVNSENSDVNMLEGYALIAVHNYGEEGIVPIKLRPLELPKLLAGNRNKKLYDILSQNRREDLVETLNLLDRSSEIDPALYRIAENNEVISIDQVSQIPTRL